LRALAGKTDALQLAHQMSIADQEYHLIDLGTGISYGGFESLEAARIIARERALKSWQIFRGNKRVEHHDPEVP
jgi:hypothetical protein